MTQPQTAEQVVPPKEEKAEEPKKQVRVYSEEEWNKNTSKLQKQIAALERDRNEAKQELAATRSEIQAIKDELALSNLTDEEERDLRRKLAQERRELERRQQTMQEAEQELSRRAKEFFAEQLATRYGVEKDSLMEYGTVAEMRAAALEAENAKLKQAQEQKPAAKPANPEPLPKHESGESLVPRKRVQDMTDDEFKEYWPKFKQANEAKNAAALGS